MLHHRYDLTLTVGEDHPSGAKAFRINSGSLELVSPVFAAMLESKSSRNDPHIIALEKDSSNAFLLLLNITHFRQDELPASLTKSEMRDLAELSDKYQINDIVLDIFRTRWLSQHKGQGELWAGTICQDWARATRSLKLPKDCEYLVNVLAMNVCLVDKDGLRECYMIKDEVVVLSHELPANMFSEFISV